MIVYSHRYIEYHMDIAIRSPRYIDYPSIGILATSHITSARVRQKKSLLPFSVHADRPTQSVVDLDF